MRYPIAHLQADRQAQCLQLADIGLEADELAAKRGRQICGPHPRVRRDGAQRRPGPRRSCSAVESIQRALDPVNVDRRQLVRVGQLPSRVSLINPTQAQPIDRPLRRASQIAQKFKARRVPGLASLKLRNGAGSTSSTVTTSTKPSPVL
ncbi:MAG TPA: hypothetical protein VKK19_06435 [Candidatus Dormibacteraeota bacterium]|nr:hypothetical protein [Candidatus Dormibacteraeota bacterium]